MGGILEDLSVLFAQSSLDFWKTIPRSLRNKAILTLLTEAENIERNRQPTMDNLSDPEATEPIMPNHLFILLNWIWFYPIRITFWEAEFSTWKTISNTDGNKKIRSEWNNVSSNSQVGDAVLVEDESCPWNLWLLPSKVGNVLLLVSQSGRKKFFQWPIHKFLSWLPNRLKIRRQLNQSLTK